MFFHRHPLAQVFVVEPCAQDPGHTRCLTLQSTMGCDLYCQVCGGPQVSRLKEPEAVNKHAWLKCWVGVNEDGVPVYLKYWDGGLFFVTCSAGRSLYNNREFFAYGNGHTPGDGLTCHSSCYWLVHQASTVYALASPAFCKNKGLCLSDASQKGSFAMPDRFY